MMFGGDKRRSERVYTHLVVQMTNAANRHFYGYIENICMNGIGIVSMDVIEPQTKLTCSFFLSDDERINPAGTVIYIRKSVDTVYRYGIRFADISMAERCLIEEYIGRGRAVG